MNAVFMALFLRCSEHPNTLRIFGLFNHTFITKDDALKLLLWPILILVGPSSPLDSMLILEKISFPGSPPLEVH